MSHLDFEYLPWLNERGGYPRDHLFNRPSCLPLDEPQEEILVDGRLFKYPGQPGSDPDGIGEYPDETIQRIEGRVLAIVDCIGDWREEIVTSLPGEVRIYTSTRPSSWRRPWLVEDRQYRLGVAAGSMGYYREPQLSGGLAL